MYEQTELRKLALLWIRSRPPGTTFTNQNLYQYLERDFPTETSQCGEQIAPIAQPRR